jgi:MFS family permease
MAAIAALLKNSRTFWAAFGGNALDNFDFNLFSFLIPTLIALWGMSRGQAGLIGTSTLLAGAIGGTLSGVLADRYGRVPVLQWTILWFSVFTFLCGFSNGFHELLWLRTLQGLGFGGELAVGAVLIGESVDSQVRGRVMGVVASGYALGSIAAVATFSAVFALLPAEGAWRWTFWLGLLPALFLLYIRRKVAESAVFERARPPAGAPHGARLARLFGRDLIGRTLPAILLVAGITAAQNIFVIWLPSYLQAERGFSVLSSRWNFVANSLGALIGFLFGGNVVDRLGRRNAFRVMVLIAFAAVSAYLFVPLNGPQLLPLGLVLGVLIVSAGVGLTPFLTELFPTEVRGTATGLCYSLGRGLGALFPAFAGYLGMRMPLGTAIWSMILLAYLVVIIAASLLPETRGLPLEQAGLHAAARPGNAH